MWNFFCKISHKFFIVDWAVAIYIGLLMLKFTFQLFSCKKCLKTPWEMWNVQLFSCERKCLKTPTFQNPHVSVVFVLKKMSQNSQRNVFIKKNVSKLPEKCHLAKIIAFFLSHCLSEIHHHMAQLWPRYKTISVLICLKRTKLYWKVASYTHVCPGKLQGKKS